MVMFTPVKAYVLYPRTREQKELRVGMLSSEDEYFREWMHGIPDVDKEFLRNRLFGKR